MTTVISCCSLPFSPVVDLTPCGEYCSGPIVPGHCADSLSNASLSCFPISPALKNVSHLLSSLPGSCEFGPMTCASSGYSPWFTVPFGFVVPISCSTTRFQPPA